jgi:hypothetical protein
MPLMSEHEFVGVLDAAVSPLAQCMCCGVISLYRESGGGVCWVFTGDMLNAVLLVFTGTGNS